MRDFDVFTTENDPYSEHDFGSVANDGTNLFWRIDYYDLSLQLGDSGRIKADSTAEGRQNGLG